jgi:hypothetical protein
MGVIRKIQEAWNKMLTAFMEQLQRFLNLPGVKQIVGFTQSQIDQIGAAWNTPVTTEGETSESQGKSQTDINNKKKEEIKLNETLTKQAAKIKTMWADVGKIIGDGLHNGIKGLIQGTQTFGQTMSNVLSSISNRLMDGAINMLLSGIFPNTGKGSIGSFLGFANGGSPPVGKASVVGEKGPELFVPKQAGTIIANDKLGGGNTTSIVVNVDASGSQVQGDDNQATELGNMLATAIQAELVRQARPGGLLAV